MKTQRPAVPGRATATSDAARRERTSAATRRTIPPPPNPTSRTSPAVGAATPKVVVACARRSGGPITQPDEQRSAIPTRHDAGAACRPVLRAATDRCRGIFPKRRLSAPATRERVIARTHRSRHHTQTRCPPSPSPPSRRSAPSRCASRPPPAPAFRSTRDAPNARDAPLRCRFPVIICRRKSRGGTRADARRRFPTIASALDPRRERRRFAPRAFASALDPGARPRNRTSRTVCGKSEHSRSTRP